MTVMILPFAENYLLTMQLNNIPFFSLEVRKARNGWQSMVQQVWFFCSHTLKDLSNSEVRLPNAMMFSYRNRENRFRRANGIGIDGTVTGKEDKE